MIVQTETAQIENTRCFPSAWRIWQSEFKFTGQGPGLWQQELDSEASLLLAPRGGPQACLSVPRPLNRLTWGNPATAHGPRCRNPDAGQIQQHAGHAGRWWRHHDEPAFSSLCYIPAARAWTYRYPSSKLVRPLGNARDARVPAS